MSRDETKHTQQTTRVVLTPSEPWPFLQAPLKPVKRKARAKRERIAKLPDALL